MAAGKRDDLDQTVSYTLMPLHVSDSNDILRVFSYRSSRLIFESPSGIPMLGTSKRRTGLASQ